MSYDIEETIAGFKAIVDDGLATPGSERIAYFAALYHEVTRFMIGPVRAYVGEGGGPFGGKSAFFDDAGRAEDFVGVFAQRYFEAYRDRANLPPGHPWKVHFDQCTSPEPTTILQILVTGANAHMNLDLPLAARVVAQPDLDSLERDYHLVNDVLGWHVLAFQDAVLGHSPTLRLIDRVPKLSAWLVTRLIVWVRGNSWKNAQQVQPILGAGPGHAFDEDHEHELAQAVGRFGERVVRPPLPLRLALRHLVARFETDDARDIVESVMGELSGKVADDRRDEISRIGARR